MINPITGWFKITQYNDKFGITITNLVGTILLNRYLWLTQIMYFQGSEFIGTEFRNT